MHTNLRERIERIFEIQHVCGKINIADIFSKEVKDQQEFMKMRHIIVTQPLDQIHPSDNHITVNMHSEPQGKKSVIDTNPNAQTIDSKPLIDNANGARTTIKDTNSENHSQRQTFQSVKLTKHDHSSGSSYLFDNQNYISNPIFSPQPPQKNTKTYKHILLSSMKNSHHKSNHFIRWKLTRLNDKKFPFKFLTNVITYHKFRN